MSSDEELYQQWRAGQSGPRTMQLHEMGVAGVAIAEGIIERLQAENAALRSEIATLRRLLDEARRELAALEKLWLNQK